MYIMHAYIFKHMTFRNEDIHSFFLQAQQVYDNETRVSFVFE